MCIMHAPIALRLYEGCRAIRFEALMFVRYFIVSAVRSIVVFVCECCSRRVDQQLKYCLCGNGENVTRFSGVDLGCGVRSYA